MKAIAVIVIALFVGACIAYINTHGGLGVTLHDVIVFFNNVAKLFVH